MCTSEDNEIGNQGHGQIQCKSVSAHHLTHPAHQKSSRKVWVPNLVTEEVECTTMERQVTEVPYTYDDQLQNRGTHSDCLCSNVALRSEHASA